MLFSSAIFLFLFLPVLLLVYYLSQKRAKNIVLLIFSLIFYLFSSVDFVLILLISIQLNFSIGELIFESKKFAKKKWLMIGILGNLGLLLHYKYIGFFLEGIINPFLTYLNFPSIQVPEILIPLALSFYTFHALSYLIDIYQKTIKPEGSFIKLALYFLLFPHLIAGPIMRFKEISGYLNQRKQTLSDFSYGIIRFITGLAKKVLIADTLGLIVDEIFAIPPQNMSWQTAWLGITCFGLQIYFDFSGYTDMAVGIARMFGFKFPENFNYPYISRSIGEFWTRWHMTLYRWFRDYVYIPLGGNRVSGSRNWLNISIVFLLAGLWHGSGWTFIIWGLLQALFIILERIRGGIFLKVIPDPLKHLYALIAISISWVFFRSENISYSLSFLQRLFLDFSRPQIEYRNFEFFMTNERLLVIIVALIISTPLSRILLERISKLKFYRTHKTVSQGLGYTYSIVLLIICMIYVASQTYSPFIYFKF